MRPVLTHREYIEQLRATARQAIRDRTPGACVHLYPRNVLVLLARLEALERTVEAMHDAAS